MKVKNCVAVDLYKESFSEWEVLNVVRIYILLCFRVKVWT